MMMRTLSLVVITILAAGCAHHQPAAQAAAVKPPESANAGFQALDDGLYDEAGRRFAHILANQPGHAEARLGLAEVHLAQDRANEALAIFATLVDDRLLGPLAQQGRGLALLHLGRRAQAAVALRQATDGASTLWRAWNAQGQIADAEMRWSDADAAYAKALAAAPNSAVVFTNLGYSQLLRGRPQEAERSLRQALALEPGHKAATANLRLVLARQGRYADALVGVRGDDLPLVLNDVGYVALSRGDLEAAETYLRRSLAISPRYLPQADANLSAVRVARKARR